ncbi:hypothetical protein CXB51_034561 [Gossypium anomalum]|uniref:CAP-Gly domain-containing protein n=1 Tax=Gossypium anomalum TaxID=47600 RepID=A0A8J6CF20_9ROSI|nr:hypothetical protein CXB51_034561 [Gossypium anomalum]
MEQTTFFTLGQRVHSSTDPRRVGTVKFVGNVEGYSGTWVGVDWDNEGDGKHDGSINGVRYFQGRSQNSASFLRPQNLSPGISLLQALKLRYQSHSTEQDEDEMYVLSARNKRVSVQLLGKDKIQDKLSRFEELTSASISYLGVSTPGDPAEISASVPNLKELDLMGNLITDWKWSGVELCGVNMDVTAIHGSGCFQHQCQSWVDVDKGNPHPRSITSPLSTWCDDVGTICEQLPHLVALNLSNNLMTQNMTGLPLLKAICVLVLNSTGINWSQVEILEHSLPVIEELHLMGNNISSIKIKYALALVNVLISPEISSVFILQKVNGPHNKMEHALHCIDSLSRYIFLPSSCVGLGVLSSCLNYFDRDLNRKEVGVLKRSPTLSKKNSVTFYWTVTTRFDLPTSSSTVQGFDSLRLLNLEDNCLAEWDEILKLSQLKSLEQLYLNKNKLTCIFYPDKNKIQEFLSNHESCEESYFPFQNLRCLLLGSNEINDLASIDSLNTFPKLIDIRLSDNPIADPGRGGLPRFVLIARLAKVEMLNGSEISARERKESEIRYVRLVMSKLLDNPEEINRLHPRFVELKNFYGIEDERPSVGAAGPQKMASGLLSITLKCVASSVGEKLPLTKKLPATTTVGKLKALCESFFKLKSLKLKLFLQEEGSPLPMLLDDEMATLMDMGIGNESTIIVDEES